MLIDNTPIQDYRREFGLFVKREDLSCYPPGPPFSKARGVYKRVLSRPETVIGVLDTSHSQAGHAVARACQILGKICWNYYPVYKSDTGLKQPQQKAKELGAILRPLPAGRSCILYHAAKKECNKVGYMMPNALKLEESVEETSREVGVELYPNWVILPASSGTIAAGVIKGFSSKGIFPKFILHLGYSRSGEQVKRYLEQMSGYNADVEMIDEGYAYKDVAKPGETPPWPCNPYYDLKAFRWWMVNRAKYRGTVLFWNIG